MAALPLESDRSPAAAAAVAADDDDEEEAANIVHYNSFSLLPLYSAQITSNDLLFHSAPVRQVKCDTLRACVC